jgi:Lon protease-like protein
MRRTTLEWPIALLFVLCTPGFGAAQSGSAEAMMLPASIPIFPLQDVTLFPHTTQPFHIFEPRYRAMVADALEGDSIIGMILLQPGHEAEYEGRPPVFDVGCAGVIITVEELPDGRYNIVLDGLVKFRVLSEDASRSYRLAEVEALPEVVEASDRPLLKQRRQQLERALLSVSPGIQLPPLDLPDEEVVDGLSLVLPLEPADRQELLEADGSLERALRLIRHLSGEGRRAALSSRHQQE